MSSRVLDYNPLTGETVKFDYDHSTDRITLTHEQEVSHIIDGNKRMQNERSLSKKGIKNDMWHYASIPNTVIIKWKNELGVDVFNSEHRKKVFALLNSPEYKYLKTTELNHAG